MPKVSVCIPTRNRSELLKLALKSVTIQDFDMEILVVDNASNDNTAEVVKSYIRKDSRIRYVKNSHNIGYRKNVERCLLLSKGKYIIFLADDDLFLPGIIKRYVKNFDSNKNLGVILCNAYQITENGDLDFFIENFSEEKIFRNGEEAIKNMLHGLIILSGIGIRKTAIANDFKIISDVYPQVELGAKILTTHQGYVLKQPFIALRLHQSNLLIEHYRQCYREGTRTYLTVEIVRILRRLNLEPKKEITKKILGYWLRSFIPAEIIIGGKKLASKFLIVSLRKHPHLIYNFKFWFYIGVGFLLPKKFLIILKVIFKKIFTMKYKDMRQKYKKISRKIINT